MRFHKFKTRPDQAIGDHAYVDLDQIHTVMPGVGGAVIGLPGGPLWLDESVADVLVLVSPPAAPDTYEEEIRDRMAAIRAKVVDLSKPVDISEALEQGERRYRIAELKRLDEVASECFAGLRDSWLGCYINARITKLEQGA